MLNLKELAIITPSGKRSAVSIHWTHNEAFIGVREFADALQFRTYFNSTKKKEVIYFPENQVVITAKNAFLKIDDKIFQMPLEAIWENQQIYVPLRYFLNLVNRYSAMQIEFDENLKQLRISKSNLNITGLSIEEKNNGTILRIKSHKQFGEREISADMRYGWLHVDFYGGKTNPGELSKTAVAGLVRQIRVFQSEQLTSIAFRLPTEPLATEIIRKPEDGEILVVLRTNNELAESEREAERPEEQPDRELQKQLDEERSKWLIDVVVIDPGHGGKDPGCVAKNKVYEKNIVLPIALKLGEYIKKEFPGVKVVYTRSTDRFISLRGRAQFANKNNGKVFVSVHVNAAESKRPSGFETYLLGPEKGEQAKRVALLENSVIDFEDDASKKHYKGINQILATMAQNAYAKQSEHLAELVQQNIHQEFRSVKLPNRGVKQGPFWVMVGSSMPSVLVETAFLSNAYDLKLLKTKKYQYKMARGIFSGLKQFKLDYENAI